MSRARWFAFGSTLTLMSCNDSTSKPLTTDAADVGTALVDAANDAQEASPSDSASSARDVTSSDSAYDARTEPPGDVADTTVITDAREEAAPPDASDDTFDATDGVFADISPPDVGDPDVTPDQRDVGTADISGDDRADADDRLFPCCPYGGPCSTFCDKKTQVCDVTTIPWPRNQPCFTIQTDAGNYPEQCLPGPSCWCMDPFFAQCISPSSTYGCSDTNGGVTISCNGCYGSPPVRWERWLDPIPGIPT